MAHTAGRPENRVATPTAVLFAALRRAEHAALAARCSGTATERLLISGVGIDRLATAAFRQA